MIVLKVTLGHEPMEIQTAPPCGQSHLISVHQSTHPCFYISTVFPTSLGAYVALAEAPCLFHFLSVTPPFMFCRISPTEWAEPNTEEHSFTLLHSFWYITAALTLQGTVCRRQLVHSQPQEHRINTPDCNLIIVQFVTNISIFKTLESFVLKLSRKRKLMVFQPQSLSI